MAQAAIKSAADRREHRRIDTAWSALLQLGNQPIRCAVANISAGGAKVRVSEPGDEAQLPEAFRVGASVVLTINGIGEFAGRLVWTEDGDGGIKFADDPGKVAQFLEFAASRPAGA